MKSIAFFNNKGGVGKTSLVYHLAYMFTELGLRVVAADLDPQANLTSMFCDEEELENLWGESVPQTVMSPIQPLLEGEGGIEEPMPRVIDGIALLAGDLRLASFEDELSLQWSRCLEGDKRAFRVIGAVHEVIARSVRLVDADIALIDVGPNLGSINRAALIAAENVVIPLAPDLFSLKGLENLGPRLRQWRESWAERLAKIPEGLQAPQGSMTPSGYVVMQHAVRLDRPVKAYGRWMQQIPETYRRAVLAEPGSEDLSVETDPHCLATLKHFRSLMPLAQEARKPMFALRAADGAIGSHARAVQLCHQDFRALAREIARHTGVSLPASPS